MKTFILSFVLVACAFAQNPVNGNRTITGAVDNSGAISTKPMKAGTSLPGACSVGEFYNKTDAPVGSNIFACTATNTWFPQGNIRRVCDISVGDTSASALTNAQLGPQKRICFIPQAATIVELLVSADAGTPNVIVGKNSAGTVTNIVSAALATAASGGIACSRTAAVTGLGGVTCSATLQNTSLAEGDYLELVSGTAGGTAKFFTAHVVYTVN